MTVPALREHFPSYEFCYESYSNELEEHAYQNQDVFGTDPDWEQVRASLIAEKDDALMEPFLLILNHFRRRLRFFDMAVYGGKGWPAEYDYLLKVFPKDLTYEYEPIEDRYGRSQDELISAEADMIRGWLDRYPEQYGFTRTSYPRNSTNRTIVPILNLRPITPSKRRWVMYRRHGHGE